MQMPGALDPYGHRWCVYDPNYYNPDLDTRVAPEDRKAEAEWQRQRALDEVRSRANDGDITAQLVYELLKKD